MTFTELRQIIRLITEPEGTASLVNTNERGVGRNVDIRLVLILVIRNVSSKSELVPRTSIEEPNWEGL